MIDLLRKFETLPLIILIVLIALDGYVWFLIFFAPHLSIAHAYFLDVGQGDSELIVFPGNIKVMVDAGPSNGVLAALAYVLSPDDRYIDLAVITHPEVDHFGGYQFLIDGGYHFGAVLYNGRAAADNGGLWAGLMERVKAQNIPFVTVGAGDRVHIGEGADASEAIVLSPNGDMARSGAMNDTAIVSRVDMPGWSILLTADMGFPGEENLLADPASRPFLRSDVLKVGHHGSKYSSETAFLKSVHPEIAVIEVGAKNTYGHPSKEALARIASSTHAIVFRTDRDGIIEIYRDSGVLKIKKEK